MNRFDFDRLDDLLSQAAPTTIEPREHHRRAIMARINTQPHRRHFPRWAMATSTLGAALVVGLGTVAAFTYNPGLVARLTNRLNLSTGQAPTPVILRPHVGLNLPTCSNEATLPCQFASATSGSSADIAIRPEMMSDYQAMDRLGRTLLAQTAGTTNGAKAIIYSSLSHDSDHYVGQFELPGEVPGAPRQVLLRWWPQADQGYQQIVYAESHGVSADHLQQLASHRLSYVGGRIGRVSSDQLIINSPGKDGSRTLRISPQTSVVASGDLAQDKRNLQPGDIVYVLAQGDTAKLVITDAGIASPDGGIVFDFFGIDLTSYEQQLIHN